MSKDKAERAKLLRESSAKVSASCDADVYFYSGAIDDTGFGKLAGAVAKNDGAKRKAILILVTNGGLANSAFQIARLLQNTYSDGFSLWCPSRCKSAGTLVALGAQRLIMDTYGDLGPLDVQLVKQNEIIARKSGLLSRSSFDALADHSFELYERLMIGISLRSRGNVSFKLASELAATMASTMMSPIYAQINPEIVGSENRDLDVAVQYGLRLAEEGKNIALQDVFRLVSEYPAHNFIIDIHEAAKLFRQVEPPSEDLYQIVAAIGDAAYDEASTTIVANLSSLKAKQDADDENAEPVQPGASDGADEPAVDDGGSGDRQGDTTPPSEDGRAIAGNDDAAGPSADATAAE